MSYTAYTHYREWCLFWGFEWREAEAVYRYVRRASDAMETPA